MIADDELDRWRDQWKDERDMETPKAPSALADLGPRVRRESRRMRWIFILKIVITLLFLSVAAASVIRSPGADTRTFAAVIILLLAVAWVIAVLIWRGIWSADASGTDEYLRLSIQRCRAALRANTFALLFSTCIFVFIAGWIYHQTSLRVALSIPTFLLSSQMFEIALAAPVVFIYLARHRQHKKKELGFLQTLETECRQAGVEGLG